MSDTMVSLSHKISSAGDLQAVVRTMKALASSSVGQYQKSVLALADYYRIVELGLGLCTREIKDESNKDSTKQAMSNERNAAVASAAIVFGSDQGLVGQFNDVVADYAIKTLAGMPGKPQVWAVGERVQERLLDSDLSVAGLFKVPESVQAIVSLVDEIQIEIEAHWNNGDFSSVYIFHNRPKTGSVYEPTSQRLLPLDEDWQKGLAQVVWPKGTLPEVIGTGSTTLRALIREYLFITLFRACAESLASENESRLAAMERAEKNISELLETLNNEFHRMRQTSIDEELFDVISGYEASTK
ncbi:F0F1 ATP synthase subunit gamma [soil metagenome]